MRIPITTFVLAVLLLLSVIAVPIAADNESEISGANETDDELTDNETEIEEIEETNETETEIEEIEPTNETETEIEEIEPTNETETEIEEIEEIEPTDETERSYLIEIDRYTRIVSAEWSDDGSVEIEIESDFSQTVVITDASQRINGAIDIRQDRVSVPGGSITTATFAVENENNPAVTVGTSRGLVGLGEQSKNDNGLISGSASWADVRSAGAAGVAAGIGTVGLIAWIRVSGRDDEHERVL